MVDEIKSAASIVKERPEMMGPPPVNESVRPEKQPASGKFGRTVMLVCLAAVLGGGTLGAGLGAGSAIAGHFLPSAQTNVEEAYPAFSFANEQTNIVPINVQVTNLSGIVKSASESVVSINVTATAYNVFSQAYESEGAGSGFIFAMDDKNVYVATNNHVIEGVTQMSISLDDKENVDAKLVGADAQSDLAVLSVPKKDLDALNIPYSAAKFGDSSALQVGDPVIAIGNSMGEGQTATSGIISAINKQITIEGKTLNVIQTDAAINMGNSGGPLVNSQGEVIGINTAKLFSSGTEGMGYSIPTNDAVTILESLRVEGSIKKPYLGILGPRTIDEDTKNLFSLPSTGVLVTDVEEKSGAEKAGLEARDLIVGYNGEIITCVEDLQKLLAASKVGDEVKLSVYRNGAEMEFTVVLGDANNK